MALIIVLLGDLDAALAVPRALSGGRAVGRCGGTPYFEAVAGVGVPLYLRWDFRLG